MKGVLRIKSLKTEALVEKDMEWGQNWLERPGLEAGAAAEQNEETLRTKPDQQSLIRNGCKRKEGIQGKVQAFDWGSCINKKTTQRF